MYNNNLPPPAEPGVDDLTSGSQVKMRSLPIVEAAHPEIALLLAQLDEATSHWRNEMLYVISDQFPEGWGRVEPTVEQIVWQSFPGGHSIGAILLHMASTEILWLHEVASGWTPSRNQPQILLASAPDQDSIDTVQWTAAPKEPLSWYFAQLDAVRARTKEMMRDADPDDVKTWARNGEKMSMRWLAGYVGLHESYHGGQCVLLSLQARQSTLRPAAS